MKIKYKEFNPKYRGEIDIMPEKTIECNSHKEVANKILELLNSVNENREIKITEVINENKKT